MMVWSIRLAVLASCIAAGSMAQAEQYAVLVGVENYQHASLRTPPLKYAVDDAADLAVFLKEKGYQVTLLTDDQGRLDPKWLPTRANIDRELQAVLRKAQADDTVVLTFSGHGLQFAGQPDAYFCPSDARPFADEAATLVSISAIYRELEKSFAGVKVILVDACRNDPDPSRGRGLDADSAPPPPKGVGALFSCSRGQKAYENDELKHGVFFYHILDGLRGAAVDDAGEVTFEGLSLHVRRRVPVTMARLIPGAKQSPNFKADLEGVPPVLVRAGGQPALLLAPFTAAAASAGQVACAKHLGTTVETTSLTTGMKLRLIPPGEFLMGTSSAQVQAAVAADSNLKTVYLEDEQPQHRVRLTKPFFLGAHEVTQGEYERVTGTNPSRFASTGGGKDMIAGIDTAQFPVESVSWYDAVDYCNKLSSADGLPAYYRLTDVTRNEGSIIIAEVLELNNGGYRLPTEAEWEYACRAGTMSDFYFGEVNNGSYANVDGNYPFGTTTKGPFKERPVAVGSYVANAFGLRDMSGNVHEWCGDWYDKRLYKKTSGTAVDPFNASSSLMRVIRGGPWLGVAGNSRSACRVGDPPHLRSDITGFRLARTELP